MRAPSFSAAAMAAAADTLLAEDESPVELAVEAKELGRLGRVTALAVGNSERQKLSAMTALSLSSRAWRRSWQSDWMTLWGDVTQRRPGKVPSQSTRGRSEPSS